MNLQVFLSGATLLSIAGLAVKVWVSGRSHKIDQPLHVEPSVCERQISANSNEHANIFARLSVSEQRLSAVEASVGHIDRRLMSMDTKLDKLLIQEARK